MYVSALHWSFVLIQEEKREDGVYMCIVSLFYSKGLVQAEGQSTDKEEGMLGVTRANWVKDWISSMALVA